MKSRRFLIAGNWKMNRNAAEGAALAQAVVAGAGQQHEVDVVVCPPFTALESVARAVDGSQVRLGAQNVHPEPSGAFTGEVSVEMLRHLFCSCVILGHSERRQYFGETDAFINAKVHAALKGGLRPIVCVGETLQQRDAGAALEVVRVQTEGCLAGVTAAQAADVVVAYEPVWAIGTGRNATAAQAQEVHASIRAILVRLFGEAGSKVRILYGGSMKPANAAELLDQPDVDGGLIGGAALDAKSFLELVRAAQERA